MTRPEPRYLVDFPVFLSWQDQQGAVRRLAAHCSNLSASGAHVEATHAFAPQTRVLVSSEGFGRLGHASIRYCRRQGMRYHIGLQFTSALALSDSMRKKLLAKAIGGAET